MAPCRQHLLKQVGVRWKHAEIPVLTSIKQVLHVFFMVVPQKPAKTLCFHTFWEGGGSRLAGSAGWLEYPFWPPKSKYYIGFSWFSFKNLQKPYVFNFFLKPKNAGFPIIAPLSVRLQFWLLNVNFTRCFWGPSPFSTRLRSGAPAKDLPEPRRTERILFHM